MGIAANYAPSKSCRPCSTHASCLLAQLDLREQACWQNVLVTKTHCKHEVVFWEGTPAEGLYLVCTGVVKLIKAGSDGHEQIVRLVGPGGYFGLPPLISQRPHFSTSKTLEPTTLRFIPRDDFLAFLEQSPAFAFSIIDQLANQLCLAHVRLRDFGCKNGRERLATLLLWLARNFGSGAPTGTQLNLELSRSDLAGMAGLTTETTIRLLSAFRQEGLLETGAQKRMTLLEPRRLQTIAGGEDLPDFDLFGPTDY